MKKQNPAIFIRTGFENGKLNVLTDLLNEVNGNR